MDLTVEDVMAPSVVVVPSTATVHTARRLMKSYGVSALPVVDSYGTARGILTSTDLLGEHPKTRRVSRVMSPHMVTVRRTSNVATAAALMRKYRIHHLLVVQAGRVAGIVSSFDLLRLVEESRGRAYTAAKKKK